MQRPGQKEYTFAFEGGKTSPHWLEFFEGLEPKKNVVRVACKHCFWTTPHPNNHSYSTSKMGSHLAGCAIFKGRQAKSIVDQLIEGGNRPYCETKMTSEKLTERVLNGAIYSNISWNAATNPVWMGLLHDAYPHLKTPDRRALALLLERKAREATADLKKRLRLNDSKVSLALDAWTCRSNNTAFQGISLSCIGPTRTASRVHCPIHGIPMRCNLLTFSYYSPLYR
jgi:hypothetical protein